MSEETKPKRKFSRRYKPRLSETVTVLDKSIVLNYSTPSDNVFSVRNVELINPDSASSSSKSQHHRRTTILDDTIGTNSTTPTIGTNSFPFTDAVFSAKNEELINPDSSQSSHHQHLKKKRSRRRPRVRMTQSANPDNTMPTNPSPLITNIANDIVFSMANVELIDHNSPVSSSHHNHSLPVLPCKTPNSECKNLPTPIPPILDSSMLINAESSVAGVLPATTIDDDMVFSVANFEPIDPNFPLSFSRQHHWLPALPPQNQEHLTLAIPSVADTSMLINAEILPASPQNLSRSDLKTLSPAIPPISDCSMLINAESWVDTTADDFVALVANMELNDSHFPPSSSHHSYCLPPLPHKTPQTEPENLPPAVPPIADSPKLINAESGVARVVPTMDAVVKVFCVHAGPNFSLPWQKKRQHSTSNSGFVIEGRRVLTNAHSVEHYTQVKLRRRGSDTKYVATVLAVGTECDIALLTVEDDEFWEGVSPVEFGDLPALQDAVTVVGYPIGGDTISVTSGVVSRIEILSYVHGSTELLGLQIDAAINSGNSGGPAFNDKGNCVGIAFQSLKHEDVENIGYVIPTPVIMHFIQDYEKNGAYTGFPILGVEWQKMENPDLRLSMGMKPDQKGVRIRRIDPTSPEFMVLKPSDVILSFDGVDIANDGTVPFRHGERIGFSYLVSQKYTGDSAAIKILRDSKTMKFTVKLGTHRRLVPAHNKGKPPSYYIIAGFVFSTVSVPYLRSEYGKDYEYEAPVKLLDKLLHEMPQSPDEQIVVVSQVLVADINIGYEEIVNTQVLAFNGQPVKNLKSLATMVESCNDEYLKFDLDYQQIVVLQTKKAKAATLDILSTHCIPSAMSDDLKTT
ncbi:hypothetical protein BUALT_Bualt07G0039100 [Buddleja alternifolia]|uniref:Protease Do-like PDZ domain-containing protein n=1 Tax=Buddleja alternifolia TaxID=168488 RepID=A0AAV6X8W3_9LAMI|nr:hypothetical protein BUALT_Bualt07G0039100 [Buddleja alternifolia]